MKRMKYKKVRKVQPNYYEYTGIHTTDPVEMQLFVYDDLGYEEYKKVSLDRIQKEIEDPQQEDDVKWLNVHGLHEVELIQKIGDMLSIEPFIVSDVLNVSRRSKMEELEQYKKYSYTPILNISPSRSNQSGKMEKSTSSIKPESVPSLSITGICETAF